jgi:hypothetical protein
VVWHCGQAPISMADPDVVARATIHTNRKMPLLFEFPLKPGPVTFVRLSQARGQQSLIIARGEMLKRDMAFTGTSGVVTFERPAREVLARSSTAGSSITWRWPMAIMSGRSKASPLPPACRWSISRIFPNIRALP